MTCERCSATAAEGSVLCEDHQMAERQEQIMTEGDDDQ